VVSTGFRVDKRNKYHKTMYSIWHNINFKDL
jgi:hypothetical protein